MNHVAVTGAAGKMGSRIIRLIQDNPDFSVEAAIERKGHLSVGHDAGEFAGCGHLNVIITDNLEKALEKSEVVIDFTEPASTMVHLEEASRQKKAVVIGTTGLSQKELSSLKKITNKIPCVHSPNMSVGVNLLFKVLADVARVTGDDYDVEIMEMHHRHKKDAPSGTAMKMAQIIAESLNRNLETSGVYSRHGMIGERGKDSIGIQSLRGGDVVGDHTVIFAGLGERIEFTHRAQSRDNFARGALVAANWVVSKPPGLYDMMDVLGLRDG